MQNDSLTHDGKLWQMPIRLETYDRSPLTYDELKALTRAVGERTQNRGWLGSSLSHPQFDRFRRPLSDVAALRMRKGYQQVTRNMIYCAMVEKGTSFWEWSRDEWLTLICPTCQDYTKKHGSERGRISLMNMAYLLGGFSDLHEANQQRNYTDMAESIFGVELIEQALQRITAVLVGREGRGYSGKRTATRPLRQLLCFLFLLNRNPSFEALSWESVQDIKPKMARPLRREVPKVETALRELGIFEPQRKEDLASSMKRQVGDTKGVPEEWLRWCEAWRIQTKLAARARQWYFSDLLSFGRWLTKNYPEIVSPEQWDEEVALNYVTYMCRATIGEHVSEEGIARLSRQGLLGKPLRPSSIDHKLGTLRKFFRDVQEMAYIVDGSEVHTIAKRFNPARAFATPEYVQRLIQPDPRDIDEVLWCKLTYAAATLTEEDVREALTGYPLAYYQAAALLWVTSARRPNEIARLQLGCVRRDWDPTMLDEHGVPLPNQEAQLFYLLVPVNKTRGAYWVPIPRYTADAIEAWERERPLKQPQMIDPKDSSNVNFLFCQRGKKMGRTFINESLIPILCKRAGVPEADARGAITGHRARSTIATMLRRNGLSLDDISQFLGHATPEMVRAYARTDQFRFGLDMNRANDLMRIVEGIIDTRAAKAGWPNVFFFLGRGADGRARFCGNPAWEKCTHRLACLKCSMYVGNSHSLRNKQGVLRTNRAIVGEDSSS